MCGLTYRGKLEEEFLMLQRPAVSRSRAGLALGAFVAFMLAFVLAGSSQPAQAQTYHVIHNFTGDQAGATPYGGPTLDRSGNLYGTTNLGGANGSGSVYKLTLHGSSWIYSPLYSFKGGPDGAGPGFGSLVIGTDGRLYGTTEGGGNFGIAFSVQPSGSICTSVLCPWTDTAIHRFGNGGDGAQPIGGLVADVAGNLYGTTSEGGTTNNGTVFELTRSGQSWTETTLYNFAGGTDGANPPAGVSLDAAGNLYGTSSFGGANGVGAIYKLTHSGSGWTESILYNFQGASDGDFPVGGVIVDQAGNLYGGTFDGGDNGGGVVYELSPSGGSWTFTTLHSFSGSFGGPYNKLAFGADGSLYGATNTDGGFGSVFKLTPSGGSWTFTDLYDFTGGADGGDPYGSVTVDAHGNVFGTTAIGGTNNQGVAFEITP
jgi:uncharacterized repeat protein (TIGR03803 family)